MSKTLGVLSVRMSYKCKPLSAQWTFYQSENIIIAIFPENIVSRSDWQYQIIVSPGGRLNKKDGLTRYGDSHVKDKTS